MHRPWRGLTWIGNKCAHGMCTLGNRVSMRVVELSNHPAHPWPSGRHPARGAAHPPTFPAGELRPADRACRDRDRPGPRHARRFHDRPVRARARTGRAAHRPRSQIPRVEAQTLTAGGVTIRSMASRPSSSGRRSALTSAATLQAPGRLCRFPSSAGRPDGFYAALRSPCHPGPATTTGPGAGRRHDPRSSTGGQPLATRSSHSRSDRVASTSLRL
jgi:hypothetical protein